MKVGFGSATDYCSAQYERQLTGRNLGLAKFLAFSSVVFDAGHIPDDHISDWYSRTRPGRDIRPSTKNPAEAGWD